MVEYLKWADVPTEDRTFYKKCCFTASNCGCVIEYMWDTRSSEEDRLHLPIDTLHACDRHKHLRDADNHEPLHEAIHGENLYFGHCMREILAALPDEHKLIGQDQDGNEYQDFKTPPEFSFNENGEMTVTLPAGLTAAQKKACTDRAKARLASEDFANPDYHPNCPKVAPFRNRKVFVK